MSWTQVHISNLVHNVNGDNDGIFLGGGGGGGTSSSRSTSGTTVTLEDVETAFMSLCLEKVDHTHDDNNDTISSDVYFSWVGQGSTILKQSKSRVGGGSGGKGQRRQYGFLAFYSREGATRAMECINTYTGHNQLLQSMQAEISTSNNSPTKKQLGRGPKNNSDRNNNDNHIRLRRQRAPPAPKHPVKKSSASSRKNYA
jgi:hypothetical protein